MRVRGTGRVFRPDYPSDGERRETGTWAIAFYDRRQSKTVKEYGFETEAQAERALRSRLVDLSRGRVVGPTVDRVRFEALAKLIRDDYKRNRRDTASRLELSIKHLARAFGNDRAVDISTDRVLDYISERQDEKAAAATINRELAALKRMFRLAVQAKVLGLDSMPHIAMLDENNVRKGFIEADQFQAIVKHLPARAARIVTVAYVTGWRVPSEVLTREVRHLDLAAGWLRLEPGETKNGRGRMFPIDMDPRLRAALKDAADEAEALRKKGVISPYLFKRSSGERILSFRKEWEAACLKAGAPGRLLHDLRRSAARNMIRAGIPQRTVMELAGWETEAMLRRYAIVDETMILEAAARNRVHLKGARKKA